MCGARRPSLVYAVSMGGATAILIIAAGIALRIVSRRKTSAIGLGGERSRADCLRTGLNFRFK